jgi:enoyl-CoA hydratase
LDYVTIE